MEELGELLASAPTREMLLAYRPWPAIQARERELLAKQNAGEIAHDEERELDQFTHA